MDTNDYPGVIRAAHDLQADIARVTGRTPQISEGEPSSEAICIGTIEKNRFIDRLIRERKLDVSQVAGQWESSLIQVVPKPGPGMAAGLVIAGSDKRGTIYGSSDATSEQHEQVPRAVVGHDG